MIGKNLVSNSATKAVVTTALVLGFLAVTLVPASAAEPCFRCNEAYSARYTALAEYYDAPAAVERDAAFDFVDHELMYAGGYGLLPGVTAERDAAFDFVDHELMYAGGYDLLPGVAAESGASCDFVEVEHEMMYAGGYAVRPGIMPERGADFDFVDHELMYAGGYGLRPGAMTESGLALACVGQ